MSEAGKKRPQGSISSRTRWLWVLLLAPLLIGATWTAGRWGIAGIYGDLADISMARWSADRGVQPDAKVSRTKQRVEQALRFDPHNPQWLEAAGRFLELKTQNERLSPVRAATELGQAADYYRQATSRRPLWPYTWTNLALVQFRSQGPDSGFDLSIARALELGAWEPRVHLSAASIAFSAWERISPEAQAGLSAAIQRGMRRDWDRIIDLANRSGRLYFVCDSFEFSQPARGLCERYGWQPLEAGDLSTDSNQKDADSS